MHTFIPLLFRTSFAYATKNLSRFQHRTHSGVAAKPPFATKKRAREHMQHFLLSWLYVSSLKEPLRPYS